MIVRHGLFTASGACVPVAAIGCAVIMGLTVTGGGSKAAESVPFTVPAWSNVMGWNEASCYSTIQSADIDGDGLAELFGRCVHGIRVYDFDATAGAWRAMPNGPHWTDKGGWDLPQYYEVIFAGDLDGDGAAELMTRDADGIAAYSYDASAKTWQLLPRGPDFSDAGGWDQAQYYKTIQAADLDGNGTAEVFARGYDGIVAYSYDASAKTWHELHDGPGWSDAEGWDKPQYYETIHAGDFDGDGAAEVFARGADGIAAYSYDASTNRWHELPHGPHWTNDGGWDEPQYYKTIQTADFDGDGAAEVFARDYTGIVAYSYDTKTKTWSELPRGPGWSDAGGWDQSHYYESIQAGDLDGDGGAEVFARGADGVGAYRYDPTGANGTYWPRLPGGPKWSDSAGWISAEYYLTIQAANAGSKTHAVLLGRYKRGIVTVQYNPAKQEWDPASLPYPQFTGEAGQAYTAIQNGLGLDKPIRDFYGTASASQLTQYNSDSVGIPSLKRPRSIDRKVWKSVTGQLENELKWASTVASAFADNETLINQVFLSDDLTLTYVAGVLAIDSESTDSATADFSDLFAGVVEAMGTGLETTAAGVITILAASAIEAGIEAGMPNGTVTEEYVKLVGNLVSDFQLAITGNANNRKDIAADYGLLTTVGDMLWSGTWSYANVATGKAYGRKEYAIFLWQTLMPIVWQWENASECFKYTYEPPGGGIPAQALYEKDTFSVTCAPTSQLDLLFEPTPESCYETFTTKCSMGLSVEEVYNDWPPSDS